MAKITIHRALSELKLIDAKIVKKTEQLEPVGLYQKGKLVGNLIDKDKFEEKTKSEFQAINDLIDRKAKIKAAIVASNGVTKVKIGDAEMSVADAITAKEINLYKKNLVNKLRTELRKYSADMNKKNDLVEANAQNIVIAAVGKDTSKADKTQVESIQGPYIENNKFSMSDVLGVDAISKDMEDKLSAFEGEIDAVLSESNAVAFIEI